MRLLQLAIGPDEILDLHPLVSVVSGLDQAERGRLTDAIVGLAHRASSWPRGLLEAHGVLFDLSPEMLELLDIVADELQPVVRADDLPVVPHDPVRRERTEAQRLLAGAEERLAARRDEHLRAQATLSSARDALARAQAARTEAAAQSRAIDALTAELAAVTEQRRHLEAELAQLSPVSEQPPAERARLEAALEEARGRRAAAVARHTELEQQLQRARLAFAPGAEAAAERAVEDLARVEAEAEAEREAERLSEAAPAPEPSEPPTERLERVEARIAELEVHLAAFVPAEVDAVARALQRVRPAEDAVLEPVPDALALASDLEALDRELGALDTDATAAAEVAEARTRLEVARQALVEAELAVRNPELDRDLVNELEQAHAELLEAIDKADSRFGGARAQRRVETLREAEAALLDQLGFTSYSDYMMGYSLLNVDPAKEAALDAARIELSSAEDVWGSLQAETDAELARAQTMEARRAGLEAARRLLGRPVAAASVVEELRALRVEAAATPVSTDDLRRALDDAGLALGDETLGRDDLVLVAESWLAEVDVAPAREQQVRDELRSLEGERSELQDVVASEVEPTVARMGPSPEELRGARLDAARELAKSTTARLAAHRDAEPVVAAGTEAVEAAADEARRAEEALTLAEAEMEAVLAEDDSDRSQRQAVEEALAEAVRAETGARERLQAHQGESGLSPEEAADQALAAAEAGVSDAESAAADAARSVEEAEQQRHEAMAAVAALGVPEDEGSVAEEIEWYILARLAAQRSVSLAGSLPLLLDDALGGLGEDELGHLLGRLERMAQAVQIIIVTDDPSASAWALGAGATRAAVVQAQPA